MAIAIAIALGLTCISAPAAGLAPTGDRIEWHDSVAVGTPEAGDLVRGVRLPAQGRTYFTWDPILKRQPDRDWRRWGTDDLVRTTLRVLRAFHREHRGAPRIGVGDLSLPEGGYFGPEVGGGIGHATHQNGRDVDVYYPRLDRAERPPDAVADVDLRLAQDLVLPRAVKGAAGAGSDRPAKPAANCEKRNARVRRRPNRQTDQAPSCGRFLFAP